MAPIYVPASLGSWDGAGGSAGILTHETREREQSGSGKGVEGRRNEGVAGFEDGGEEREREGVLCLSLLCLSVFHAAPRILFFPRLSHPPPH